MKKVLKIIGVLILMLILFRGIIFRFAIKYNEIGARKEIKIVNTKLIEKIESNSKNRKIDLKEIIEIANKITKEELKFTTKKASNNPNKLINTNRANCVGYSAMFNSIVNYLLIKNKLQNEVKAEHKIGKLEFFGINIHKYFESPFFKNHDFNKITNKKTGKITYIDPSINDYLWISKVASKKNNCIRDEAHIKN